MTKKLTKIGSSRGIILDKTILGLLGIDDDGEVSMRVEGHQLIIEAAKVRPRVMEAYRKMAALHAETLSKLAK